MLTAAPSAGQAQPAPDAETNEVPTGTVSVTVIGPREVDGPRLATFSVYVTLRPASSGPLSALVMARSAWAVNGTVSVSVLGVFGSKVRPDTCAVLLSVVGIGASLGMATRNVIRGKESPLARVSSALARVHDTTAPTAEQVQPSPDAPTNVIGASTVSVTVNGPTAVSGPSLRASIVQSNVSPATGVPMWPLSTIRSAEWMRATALAGPALYGPAPLPWAPVASSAVVATVLVCAIDEPAPASTAAPGCGVAVKVTTIDWPGLRAPRSVHVRVWRPPALPRVGVGAGDCAVPATSTLEVSV